MEKIKESDLFDPVKEYLESLGYDVKGEVKNCDITAIKDDEVIVVELKKGFTLELVYQGLNRQAIADSVYLAVPLPKKGYFSARHNDNLRLCKRLELGLIYVGFTTKGKAQVDVVLHPAPASAIRKNKKKRLAVITEHRGRTGSVNTGGVTRRKIITVYKEQALAVAEILSKNGELKTAEIRKLGGPENTSKILRGNHYKWYEKAGGSSVNTVYKLTQCGYEALNEYKDLL